MQPLQPRILCIDDDEDTCMMLTIALGMSNYEVESANTFATGLIKLLRVATNSSFWTLSCRMAVVESYVSRFVKPTSPFEDEQTITRLLQ
jgi:hypothetical protein